MRGRGEEGGVTMYERIIVLDQEDRSRTKILDYTPEGIRCAEAEVRKNLSRGRVPIVYVAERIGVTDIQLKWPGLPEEEK